MHIVSLTIIIIIYHWTTSVRYFKNSKTVDFLCRVGCVCIFFNLYRVNVLLVWEKIKCCRTRLYLKNHFLCMHVTVIISYRYSRLATGDVFLKFTGSYFGDPFRIANHRILTRFNSSLSLRRLRRA